MTQKIAILGSTGSIGTQTLDVIKHNPDSFRVEALAAGENLTLLAEQIHTFKPKKVSVATRDLAEQLGLMVNEPVDILYGPEGLAEVAAATEADTVVTAVVGSQGLGPTLQAIEAGKTIAIANKETLVSAGHLVTQAAAKHGVSLLPVDSEHSAIFQCLNGEERAAVAKIILTASGGSFRDKTREELEGVTVEDALKHPNWAMGAKITIDSATMANKGLEVIEAHWLYSIDYDRLEVLLHPESIIHSMVQFVDHSVIAQLGNPDMRVPIQYALSYPNRKPTPTEPLDLIKIGTLHFKEMDLQRFPCLAMAIAAGRAGGSVPAVYNAANEVAVARFLAGSITFLQIEETIDRVLDAHEAVRDPNLDEVLACDQWARETAHNLVF
ncbi:1-deoxy-D-xylulose-5-phosphate reductoisomerase [Paenibacillus senegalensis]|uniref:1-deoxy-D-xylulose-5-phosphate reductoisomerase n=1 Tax=Paenibacillus senegalensis TaxID=1465766 RepID=UPI0002888BBD|nr:1-deoxy-D-xylulose-5-phosphate reductoisomerase [Paenibacillus senegalensis]